MNEVLPLIISSISLVVGLINMSFHIRDNKRDKKNETTGNKEG